MAKRVTESIISITLRPWSRKYSAMAVAVNAAFRRTRAGWSEVAQTTTERARPSAPRSRCMNSSTSRPRSPTRQMTLISSEVERAIMPSSEDLPTPEPAKMPRRWPRPQGTMASSARTPSDTRSSMRGRESGSGGAASAGRHMRVRDRALAVQRTTEAVQRAAQQGVADVDRERLAGGGHARARADARGVAERHQQRAAGAEADDLGGHGRTPAAGLDRAHLADLGLEAGGFDDQADQVDHAARPPAQIRVADRQRGL